MMRITGGENEMQTIISAAVYDLKTPLTLIRGLNDLMNSGKLDKKSHDLYVSRIATSVDQMQRIIDTISSLDKIIAKQQSLPIEPVNICQVVEEVAHQLDSCARDYNQKLIIKHGRTSAVVLSNKQALESVVYGLVDNAIKYSTPNSNILIRPSLASRRGFTRLTVRDKTVGVRKSDISRIMKTLGQTSSPNPAYGSNSGLGLYATMRLVESLNGAVGVKPVPGGSSFFVELPIAQQLSLYLPKS